jgi:hypothetical protein
MTKTINFDHGHQCYGCCKECTGATAKGLLPARRAELHVQVLNNVCNAHSNMLYPGCILTAPKWHSSQVTGAHDGISNSALTFSDWSKTRERLCTFTINVSSYCTLFTIEQFCYITLLIVSLLPFTTATCYFPDGTIPRQDTPCRSSGFSTCCGAGYACLSNNLCMLTKHVANPIEGQSIHVRGSCTDESWNSEFCPNICVTPSNDDNWSGGMGVNKCITSQDRYYCLNNQTQALASSEICW